MYRYVLIPAILEDGTKTDTDDDTTPFGATSTLLLTGRGPVTDEMSTCSVATGSLMSSSQDTAVAGPSRVTPTVLRLPRPGVSATVTSGVYLNDLARETSTSGEVLAGTVPEDHGLPITGDWIGEVECEVVIDDNFHDYHSLTSTGASVLVTAAVEREWLAWRLSVINI